MPLDAIFLSALTRELREKTVGAKIDRVQQPERDKIVLTLRTKGESLRLLLAAGTGSARVHLSREPMENPAEPPMFCMLLRKHLSGARIAALHQPEHERLLIFELETRDELGFSSSKKLTVEMIGRSSNLILTDAEGRIVDCLRRTDFGGDAQRRMLPGMIYRLPPAQGKPALLDTQEPERKATIDAANPARPVDKWLLDSYAGLSPLICRELAYRCEGSYERLPGVLNDFIAEVTEGRPEPWLFLEGDRPLEFSFLPLRQYGDAVRSLRFDSFSKLLDAFYGERDRRQLRQRRSHELKRQVRTLRDRQQRKLAEQGEELRRTETREELRKTAELITANIYRMKKGERVLRCQDYYTEGSPEIEIALDPLKTPQQNAAARFKEYGKQKAAREHLTRLLEEGEKRLEYLNSVLGLIDAAESERDLAELRRELIETGMLRAGGEKKRDRGRPQAPLCFETEDGFAVLVGRSNLQNDELTTRIGRRTDYWLHTQKIHGSHVILRCEGAEPSDLALEQAAVIAAYYSQGRDGGKIPVDCTMLRNVRKPSGALPGKVIYTDYRTIVVSGDRELVNRLRKK